MFKLLISKHFRASLMACDIFANGWCVFRVGYFLNIADRASVCRYYLLKWLLEIVVWIEENYTGTSELSEGVFEKYLLKCFGKKVQIVHLSTERTSYSQHLMDTFLKKHYFRDIFDSYITSNGLTLDYLFIAQNSTLKKIWQTSDVRALIWQW